MRSTHEPAVDVVLRQVQLSKLDYRPGPASTTRTDVNAHRKLARSALVLGSALGFALLACAQTTAPASAPTGPLNLRQAVETAQLRYPAIVAAQERQQAARASIGLARTAYLPRVDMLWQGNRATTNKPNMTYIPEGIVPVPNPPARPTTGRSDWNSLAGVLFAWQPFDFGVRHGEVRAAGFQYESAQHATALSRLDVGSAAAGAFFDVVAARQTVAVQQANMQRMEAFAHAVHVLVDNQLRPGADASQADAQLAAARTQLIQAQTQAQIHLDALANFLQVSAADLNIDDPRVLGDAPSDNPRAVTIDAHPAVQQEQAFLNEQKQNLHVLSRSYAPAFTLYGSVSGLGSGLSNASPSPTFKGGTAGLAPDTYNWVAALQVTFPAFQIFSLHQQKKQQQAQVLSTQAAWTQMRSDLSAQVKEAQAMLDGARRVAQNTPVELSAARASEQQQQARYRSGLATVIEVSAAEAALAQAEADDALARLNVWRGLAGVAEAQGDLSPFLQLLGQP